MPKFRSLVESATAPIRRITPDRVKNQRLAPMKSKCHLRPSPPAPSALAERSTFELLIVPSSAWVKTTAVSSEVIVPTPSVKAKPLTPAVARTKRMKAVRMVTTFASTIVEIPRL